MYLELDGHGALYEQLARALKRAVLQGQVGAGSRLPATRELSDAMCLSRNTVVTAYELLCAEGLAVSRHGSGTFVAGMGHAARSAQEAEGLKPQSRYAARLRKLGPVTLGLRRPGLRYDLQYGVPVLNPPLLGHWRSELAYAATHTDMHQAPIQGHLGLRQAISEYLARRRGVQCNAEQVLIINGTQQAVDLLARVLLNEGDSAVMEDPHYQFARHALRAHGARIVDVPVDEEGLVTAQLPRQAPRLIFTTPSHQFPFGSVMSLKRRAELLQYAVDHDSWIVEDDYDAEFRYESRPVPALRSLDLQARVIYVGSFSKTLFPSLRLGYMVCPAGLRTDLVSAKRLADLGSPTIEQAAMARFVQSGRFETHLRKSIAELRRRRTALLQGLARHAAQDIRLRDSRAGMHVVGWLPRLDYAQLDALIERAASRGLGLHPIHPYYRSPPADPGLLLGFAALSVTQIGAATKALGACLREV